MRSYSARRESPFRLSSAKQVAGLCPPPLPPTITARPALPTARPFLMPLFILLGAPRSRTNVLKYVDDAARLALYLVETMREKRPAE